LQLVQRGWFETQKERTTAMTEGLNSAERKWCYARLAVQ
jgi:hypothetical protein